VVLVRPWNPANLGSVARVVKNFGLRSLSLVEPAVAADEESGRLAAGADDVLAAITRFGSLAEALAVLEKGEHVRELAARVDQLEREADRVHQDAIVALFDDERDPIVVIKWKEILDFLEAATDRCEDVANLLEGVVVKHG